MMQLKKTINSNYAHDEETLIQLFYSKRFFSRIDKDSNKLKFVHITKNAGTSIEDIAKEYGVNWGRHEAERLKQYKKKLNFKGAIWHTPPKFIPEAYKGYNTFAVVRNPYDRCISEMHCPWTQKLLMGSELLDTKEKFNRELQKLIVNVNTDHFYPQYHYTHDEENKIVTHILRFENLKKDFNQLMSKYKLKLRLNKHINAKPHKNWINLTPIRFTIKDLNKESIELINKVYDIDFKIFNYEKIF